MKSLRSEEKEDGKKSTLLSSNIRKIEKANMFLVNPKEVTLDQEEGESQFEASEGSEPWLELVGDSETVRQHRVIEAEMQHILAKDGRKKALSGSRLTEEEGFDTRKLVRKMKKYQPANSSFSLFYGEKQEVEELEAAPHKQLTIEQRRRLLRLPALNRPFRRDSSLQSQQ